MHRNDDAANGRKQVERDDALINKIAGDINSFTPTADAEQRVRIKLHCSAARLEKLWRFVIILKLSQASILRVSLCHIQCLIYGRLQQALAWDV